MWTHNPPFPRMDHPSRAQVLFPAGFLIPESGHRQKMMPLQLPRVLHHLPGIKVAAKSSQSIAPCSTPGPGDFMFPLREPSRMQPCAPDEIPA